MKELKNTKSRRNLCTCAFVLGLLLQSSYISANQAQPSEIRKIAVVWLGQRTASIDNALQRLQAEGVDINQNQFIRASKDYDSAENFRLALERWYMEFNFPAIEDAVAKELSNSEDMLASTHSTSRYLHALAYSVLLADAEGELKRAKSQLEQLFQMAPGYELPRDFPRYWQDIWMEWHGPYQDEKKVNFNGYITPEPLVEDAVGWLYQEDRKQWLASNQTSVSAAQILGSTIERKLDGMFDAQQIGIVSIKGEFEGTSEEIVRVANQVTSVSIGDLGTSSEAYRFLRYGMDRLPSEGQDLPSEMLVEKPPVAPVTTAASTAPATVELSAKNISPPPKSFDDSNFLQSDQSSTSDPGITARSKWWIWTSTAAAVVAGAVAGSVAATQNGTVLIAW